MVFLQVVGRRRGRNAFCAHSMNAANLRAAAYGAVNSARSRGIPKPSWAPLGAGSALHLCTRGSLTASSWPVDGMWMARQGAQGEKKKKRIWLAVRAAGAVTDAAIYTIFTFGRTKRRRLPTTLRNSAFALLTRSANPRAGADRVPLHRPRASLF